MAGRPVGTKLSQETKDKMRKSAIERNKNPEYIQKLKDSHSSKQDPDRWKEMCEAGSVRMKENNPMKDPKISSKMSKSLIESNRTRFENSTYRFRLDVLERDSYCCQRCGLTNMLSFQIFGCRNNVHHIDYNKNNNDIKNGITLCQHCHSKTTKFNKQYWIGYYTAKME